MRWVFPSKSHRRIRRCLPFVLYALLVLLCRGSVHPLGTPHECLTPPPSWRLSRVAPGVHPLDSPLSVYSNVLQGSCCIAGGACAAAGGVPAPRSSVVWLTHASADRFGERIPELLARWRGCVAVAVQACSLDEWRAVDSAWRSSSAARAWVTVHAAIGASARSTAGEAEPLPPAPVVPASAGVGVFFDARALFAAASPPAQPPPRKRFFYPGNALRNAAAEPLRKGGSSEGRFAWALLADVDALPSLSEAALRGELERAHAPGGVGGDCSTSVLPLPHPLPHCAPGNTSMLEAWVLSESASVAAAARGRCAHEWPHARTLFVVSAFDVKHDARAHEPTVVRSLLGDAPPLDGWVSEWPRIAASDAAAARAAHHALVRCGYGVTVELQALEFKPAYAGLAHWRAWLHDNGDAGAMPTRWSHSFEPYVALSTAALQDLPRFDEFYRGFGLNKAELFTGLFARPSPEWTLAHLPRAFLLQRGRAPRYNITTSAADLWMMRLRFAPILDKALRSWTRLGPCDAEPSGCWCLGGSDEADAAGLTRNALALPDADSSC